MTAVTKTIVLTDGNRRKIDRKEVNDDNGFCFWSNANLNFSTKSSPAIDEQIPLVGGDVKRFAKPTTFYIQGAPGDEVYLAPFEGVFLSSNISIGGAGLATEATLLSLQSQSLKDKYSIANIDDTGVVNYYGYTSPEGYRYIMRETVATDTYEYATGVTPYPAERTARAGQAYSPYLILS